MMDIRNGLRRAWPWLAFAWAGASQAQTLDLSQALNAIKGRDGASGVGFQSVAPDAARVVVDATVGDKQVRAEIDYRLRTVNIVSLSKATKAPVALSAQDIRAFQALRATLPQKIGAQTQTADALSSLVNLLASAPAGATVNISTLSGKFSSICPSVGQNRTASYRLGGVLRQQTVTTGPVCYLPPALGRCGAGAGPDQGVGLAQRFTQECLNHDQCCVATASRRLGLADVCGAGADCVPEFVLAAPGFFFAPDCGATAGGWTDNFGFIYALEGGDGSGEAKAFKGTVDTQECGLWKVAGTRTGQRIVFKATNPAAASNFCAASFSYAGAYGDCSYASGTWTNSSNFSGVWSWTRNNATSVLAASAASLGGLSKRPTAAR